MHARRPRAHGWVVAFVAAFTGCSHAAEDVDVTVQELASGPHAGGGAPAYVPHVTAYVDCVDDPDNSGRMMAHFGYPNDGSRPVFLPIGPLNTFSPKPWARGQPTRFEPGAHDDVVVEIENPRRPLIWRLDWSFAVASLQTPRCQPKFGGASSAIALSSSQITVSWSPVADPAMAADTVYEICASTESRACANAFIPMQTTSAGATMWNIAGFEPNTRYYFIVRARNAERNDTNVVEVSAETKSRSPLALGYAHTCLLSEQGTVQCWGDNSYGVLGNGSIYATTEHVQVSGLQGVTALAAGQRHTCALLGDGSVRCWGHGTVGELGDGEGVSSNEPVAVAGLANVVALTAGSEHTCALLRDGTAQCWGDNVSGALGGGPNDTPSLTPIPVRGLEGAIALTTGGQSCAILMDGSAKCWGSNRNGEVGVGTQSDSLSTPTPVVGLSHATSIAAGRGATCALRSDGPAVCWGFQAGVGDVLTPTPLPGLDGSIALAGGGGHFCALKVDRTVACWGSNYDGQLGTGTRDDEMYPTAVSGLVDALAIGVDESYSCAALSDGTIQCWGSNIDIQPGDPSSFLVPTTVVCASPNLTACAGECTNRSTDPKHCGTCANACPTNIECVDGECMCPTGTQQCAGSCAFPDRDASNCGACGRVCPSGGYCSDGECQCPQGTQLCGDACVDLSTDHENCGLCSHRCPFGVDCISGACPCPAGLTACDHIGPNCYDLMTSDVNCGDCGNDCSARSLVGSPSPAPPYCVQGACACPEGKSECIPTGTHHIGCFDFKSDPNHCGSCNRPCASGKPCVDGKCSCPAGCPNGAVCDYFGYCVCPATPGVIATTDCPPFP